MYKGTVNKNKTGIRIIIGILAIYIGYREISLGRWIYVPFAVLLLLACFFEKNHYVSEEGVIIEYKLFSLKKKDIWSWDEITAMLIDPITQGDNVRIQFAKDVSIRAFTFPKKDLNGIKELIREMNPEIIGGSDD